MSCTQMHATVVHSITFARGDVWRVACAKADAACDAMVHAPGPARGLGSVDGPAVGRRGIRGHSPVQTWSLLVEEWSG